MSWWLALALVCAVGLVIGVLVWLPGKGRRATEVSPQPPVAAAGAHGAPAAQPSADPREVPAELDARLFSPAGSLPPERKQVFLTLFRQVPRPPRILDQLLSPDFVRSASSSQLVDLIVAEPLISTKVLTAVNSPLYGLSRPVGSIELAVTYLGLNSVRTVCLQYLLISAFKADSDERKKRLDDVWSTSAAAVELTRQLAQELALEDSGSLMSAVALSFLGRLAVIATVPRGLLKAIPAHGLYERAQWAQTHLGLPAGEIGRMLMQDWGLPAPVVDDAAGIDSVLFTPPPAPADNRSHRLALAYLCTRLAEKLCADPGVDLASFDPLEEAGLDFFHLRAYLADPRLARLPGILKSPQVVENLQKLQQSLRS